MTDLCTVTPTWNEEERLKAVDSYGILDTPKEEDFEDIVKMAAQACNVPISLISFVAKNRQWFKASVGTEMQETELDVSICSHAILQPGLFVVPDTTKDVRFQNNRLVKGDPHLRFYAGALLETPGGLPLGTVCILDYQPRTLTEQEAMMLKTLARQVMTQLELRRALSELRNVLKAKNENEERLHFISRLTQNISTISDPNGIIRLATSEVGQFLRVDRCYFFEIVKANFEEIQVLPDWRADREASLEGTYQLREFGLPERWAALQNGSIAIEDVRTHPWSKDFAENYRGTKIVGCLMAPFSREGTCVAGIGVSAKAARTWKAEEQTLLEDVMARVWPLIERSRIELAFRESEERFRAMSDNIAPLAWMAKADGLLFWYNKRWYDYTGETLERMLGDGWAKVHDPAHLPHAMASWKHAVHHGFPWEDTFPLRGKDGHFRWFLSRAFPIRDASGKVTLWFGVNTDITELRDAQTALRGANILLGDKAAHLESIVRQRTHKLSEIIHELEAFSYSISHDMRAPLRSMIGFSELLKLEYSHKLEAEAVDYLDRIAKASRRMDQLIRDVLIFSRTSRAEDALKPVDTDTLIREIMFSYPNLHADKVKILVEDKLPPVKGNEALLTQCFSNLLENGAKFVALGVSPEIKVWGEVANGRTRLYFKDNGIGIAENDLTRIFDIFYRVGREGEGTGIGLAVVKKAVEKMGGTLGVTSELGKGSLFWIDLQCAET